MTTHAAGHTRPGPATPAHIRLLVDGLPWPLPWDRQQFLSDLGILRGRPIHVRHADVPALGTEQVVVTENADYLFVSRDTLGVESRLVLFRGLGRLLLGHLNPAPHAPGTLMIHSEPPLEREADQFAAYAEQHLHQMRVGQPRR